MSDVENALFVQHLLEEAEDEGWNTIGAHDFVSSDDDDIIILSDGEGDQKRAAERKARHSDSTLAASTQQNVSSLASSLHSSMRAETVGLNVFHNVESPPEYMFSNESLVKYDPIGTLIHKLVVKLFRLLHPLVKGAYLEHEVKLAWFHHLQELIHYYLF